MEQKFDHIVFNRPAKSAVYFCHDGTQFHFDASGDTWGRYGASDDGNPPQPPYGHCCPIAPGHYELGQVDDNGSDCTSEGPFQIWVLDLKDETKEALVASGHCIAHADTGTLDIGGINLSRGGLAAHGRSEVMIHGGGSNLGIHALDNDQQLLRTWGCTRVHNGDLKVLAHLRRAAIDAGITTVFSCIGDPASVDG